MRALPYPQYDQNSPAIIWRNLPSHTSVCVDNNYLFSVTRNTVAVIESDSDHISYSDGIRNSLTLIITLDSQHTVVISAPGHETQETVVGGV